MMQAKDVTQNEWGTFKIYQGHNHSPVGGIAVVIDVLRAFSVSHVAFLRGAKKLLLAKTPEDAFQLGASNKEAKLIGEVEGYKIPGFDYGNSPIEIFNENLEGRTLIHRTTNGVVATMNCRGCQEVIVTGYTNLISTATYLQRLIKTIENPTIQIIASHPSSDEDLACAELLVNLISNIPPNEEDILSRMRNAYCSQKFLDPDQPEFPFEDLEICLKKMECDFVMSVDFTDEVPQIIRKRIS